jgi:hypothetical protein
MVEKFTSFAGGSSFNMRVGAVIRNDYRESNAKPPQYQ